MPSSPIRSRRRWLTVVAALVFLATLAAVCLAELGRWLIVTDPLEPARAIVVLNGSPPYRAEEAARIYRQGFAPEVWVTPYHPFGALERLGIQYVGEETYNAEVLKKFGVPAEAIRTMPERALNTEEEEGAVLRELKRVGGDRIILVTSMQHTRRAKAIWRRIAGQSARAIVRGAPGGPHDTIHWWRNAHDAVEVAHEVFGLLAMWAGSHIQPVRE